MTDYLQNRCPNCGEETEGGYCCLQCEEEHYQKYKELQLEIVPVSPSQNKKRQPNQPIVKPLN